MTDLRNRAAQEATLINIRALKKRVRVLEKTKRRHELAILSLGVKLQTLYSRIFGRKR